MNIEILIPIAVIIGCILLIIIKSAKNEHFLSERIESDIILPNPVPTFQYDLDPKKDLIIGSNDKNNNFPIADIKIVPPKINNNPPKKDEAFKDNEFIRDKGVENAMNNKNKTNDIDYSNVINSYLNFKNPENSGDLLTNLSIKDFSKDELKNSYLHDIFNKMSAKVINNVSNEQINNIMGKPIEENKIDNLYKPVLSLIDENLKYNDLNDIQYKYSAYNELPIGSLI